MNLKWFLDPQCSHKIQEMDAKWFMKLFQLVLYYTIFQRDVLYTKKCSNNSNNVSKFPQVFFLNFQEHLNKAPV